MRVYVDLAFAVNAVIDYLLLVCSARLSGAAIRRGRLLLAAALGGGFAAGSFVLWCFAPVLNAFVPNHRLGGLLFNPFGWQMLFYCSRVA